MTTAPPNLKAARRLLLDHLDMHPGSNAYSGDLDPDEIGIVGDALHFGGYHCGRDRVDPAQDYSVVESPRDKAGLSEYASALDVGQFRAVVAGTTHDLRSFSGWLFGECERGAPDTSDIREIIYTLDGVTVRRWDRLRKRTSGSNSHLTHTHISEFRDARGRNMPALMRRYLTHIGLIPDEGDDDMGMDQSERATVHCMAHRLWGIQRMTDPIVIPAAPTWGFPTAREEPNLLARAILAAATTPEQLAAITAAAEAGAHDGTAGPSLDQIRAVVDQELDEQSRAGADTDPA
jgi:hypothetical protein